MSSFLFFIQLTRNCWTLDYAWTGSGTKLRSEVVKAKPYFLKVTSAQRCVVVSCMIDYHFIKVIHLIYNASQPHWQMSLEDLHTTPRRIRWHEVVSYSRSQSPHTQNFNKSLFLRICIIYPWAVTSEVHIVFQALRPHPRDFTGVSARCSGDDVPLYHCTSLLWINLSVYP